MVYEMRTKTRTGYFFLLFWGYLYHTISIRDLKIELFKVIFHRGQLPCSGLNQRTKENVIAKGRLFKVYHSNSKGCQNFGRENWFTTSGGCPIGFVERMKMHVQTQCISTIKYKLPLICFIIITIIIIIIIIIDTDEIPGFFLLLKN